MAKRPPPDLPKDGDRVTLRGRAHAGELVAVCPENNWAFVAWDWECYLADVPPAVICHLYELQKAHGHGSTL